MENSYWFKFSQCLSSEWVEYHAMKSKEEGSNVKSLGAERGEGSTSLGARKVFTNEFMNYYVLDLVHILLASMSQKITNLILFSQSWNKSTYHWPKLSYT